MSSGLNYGFRTASADGLYQIAIAAFGAVPGKIYMEQLAGAYEYFNNAQSSPNDGTVALGTILEILTGKAAFTDIYPETLSHREFATKLVNRVVKSSAVDAVKLSAIDDLEGALNAGWSRAKVILQGSSNLSNIAETDPAWGNTARQFQKQLAVARYYTEVAGLETTDLSRLQGVLSTITPESDVSTVSKIVEIIGTPPPGG
jgi:hypothetical protein